MSTFMNKGQSGNELGADHPDLEVHRRDEALVHRRDPPGVANGVAGPGVEHAGARIVRLEATAGPRPGGEMIYGQRGYLLAALPPAQRFELVQTPQA